MKLIETIAARKLTNGSFIVRNVLNKSLNKVISKILKMKDSVVLYKGISQLDNETPIMVVLSGYNKDSENIKTGVLAQIYILPIHDAPFTAYKTGSKAVCGTCKYNGNNGCYVRWSHLKGLWNSTRTQNPISKELTRELLKGLRVRVGAAGDPLAVPVDFWKDILSSCDSFTGYTHQWRESWAWYYRDLFMASVDNACEQVIARSYGWNTFYVTDGEEPPEKSVQCLATIEGKKDLHGQDMTCAYCMLCNGKGTKTVTAPLHGASNTMSKARIARA